MKQTLEEKLQRFRRLLIKLIKPGERIVAAVSGGADSMALLALLHEAQAACGYELLVAHVHHHLRAASDAEWQFVEDYCAALGVPFYGCHVDVQAACAESHHSMEAEAHRLRHEALQTVVQAHEASWLVLAHHAGDRAETVLMNLLRGTGPGGLAAMPVQNGNLLRPMLVFTRADIEMICAQRGISFVTDESNSDTTILRNRIRHELLPMLETYNPQVVLALNRLAESSACDQAYIQSQAEILRGDSSVFQAKRWCLLRRETLIQAHTAVQNALLRAYVQKFSSGRGGLRFEMVEEALRLFQEGKGRADLGQGIFCECTRRFVYIGAQPQGKWWRDEIGNWHHDFLEAVFTAPKAFSVRTYCSGDTVAVKNLGRKSIKKLFQEWALPPCLRSVWPLVYDTKIKEIICVPFLASGRQLMYYNSVTFLKVKPIIRIAQYEERYAFTAERDKEQ